MNNLDELVALFDDDFSEETSRNLEDEATSNGVIKGPNLENAKPKLMPIMKPLL